MTVGIAELWEGLEQWLQVNAPRTFATLNPPADATTLAWLEEQLGLELPAELAASMRRHNGVDNTTVGPGFSLLGGFYLQVAAGIAADAALCRRGQSGIPEMHGLLWHEAWIPFAADFGGDYLVYDTRPHPPFGRVFYKHMVNGPSSASWNSLESLLADTLDALGQKRLSRARRLPRESPRLFGWATNRPAARDGVLEWDLDRD